MRYFRLLYETGNYNSKGAEVSVAYTTEENIYDYKEYHIKLIREVSRDEYELAIYPGLAYINEVLDA